MSSEIEVGDERRRSDGADVLMMWVGMLAVMPYVLPVVCTEVTVAVVRCDVTLLFSLVTDGWLFVRCFTVVS